MFGVDDQIAPKTIRQKNTKAGKSSLFADNTPRDRGGEGFDGLGNGRGIRSTHPRQLLRDQKSEDKGDVEGVMMVVAYEFKGNLAQGQLTVPAGETV